MFKKAILLAALMLVASCGREADDIEKKKSGRSATGSEKSLPSQTEKLYYALEDGSAQFVTTAIANGADINAILPNGETPLTYILKYTDEEQKSSIFHVLMRAEPDLNKPNSNGKYPIHIAVEEKDTTSIFFLLRKGVDVNARDEKCMTPLLKALELGDEFTALRLLKSGADVTEDTDQLFELADRENLNRAKELIEDIQNFKKNNSLENLKSLLFKGNSYFISYLIKQENLMKRSQGLNILAQAMEIQDAAQRERIINLLLIKGFNANGENGDTKVPLALAVKAGSIEIADKLLYHGANPDVLDEDYLSPLAHAVERLDSGMVKILVGYGAKKIYDFDRDGIGYTKNVCANLPDGGWLFFGSLTRQEKRNRDEIRRVLSCY